MVDRLNYITHAIPDLREFANGLRGQNSHSYLAVEWVIERLSYAVKFLLPDRADLLDLTIQQHHIDTLRLPYPIIAIEAPWSETPAIGQGLLKQEVSTRRIALYLDTRTT